jgi:hypothetical protein
MPRPSAPCDQMVHRHHSVSRSQQVRVGCDGIRWVVDVVELIRPRRVKRASVIRTRIPKSSKHDLKKGSKDRPGPERSEATRGELNAAVQVPSGACRIRKRRAVCEPPGVDFAQAWVPYGAGPFSPHCIQCSPCCQRDRGSAFAGADPLTRGRAVACQLLTK